MTFFIVLHVSNAMRLQCVLARYAEIFKCGSVCLSVTCCPSLASKTDIMSVLHRQAGLEMSRCHVRWVDNRGLDFGGFYDGYRNIEHLVQPHDYVLKCHDKVKMCWLWGLLDPLMLHLTTIQKEHCSVAVSHHHLSTQGAHQLERHAYWLAGHGLTAEDPMLAGGVFCMRGEVVTQWLASHVNPDDFTARGKLDPSWFYYRYGEQLHTLPALWTSESIRSQPVQFRESMVSLYDSGVHVANGMDYRGPSLVPSDQGYGWEGHAVRDGMYEHSLERKVLLVEGRRLSLTCRGDLYEII